jgi:hypothetical protein
MRLSVGQVHFLTVLSPLLSTRTVYYCYNKNVLGGRGAEGMERGWLPGIGVQLGTNNF